MKLTSETKLFLGIIAATIAIIGGALWFFSKPAEIISKDKMIPSGTTTRGNTSSKVYLVEFSDFQCPACKAAKPIVDEILKTYGDKILFAYRHFPLDQHQFSTQAALVAEAAGKQGKFWEMGDYLFANQETMSEDMFIKGAESLKLNMEHFAKDRQDQTLKDKILRDKADGNAFGIQGTPTFFLNGNKINLLSSQDLITEVQKAVNEN